MRSASRRPFSNPAASAISIVNNTAVDLFQNLAHFAGDAAAAVHGHLGSPAAAPHSDAGGGAAEGAQQSAAAGGSPRSFASAAASAGKSANRVAGTMLQGARRDASAAGASAGSMAQNEQAPGAAGMHASARPVAVDPDQSTGRNTGTRCKAAAKMPLQQALPQLAAQQAWQMTDRHPVKQACATVQVQQLLPHTRAQAGWTAIRCTAPTRTQLQ